MKNIKATQIGQNKGLRLLNRSRVKDKRSIQAMLEKFDLPSINQSSVQIKPQEAWNRDQNFPIKLMRTGRTENEAEPHRMMRATARNSMREGERTRQVEERFIRDSRTRRSKKPKQ